MPAPFSTQTASGFLLMTAASFCRLSSNPCSLDYPKPKLPKCTTPTLEALPASPESSPLSLLFSHPPCWRWHLWEGTHRWALPPTALVSWGKAQQLGLFCCGFQRRWKTGPGPTELLPEAPKVGPSFPFVLLPPVPPPFVFKTTSQL